MVGNFQEAENIQSRKLGIYTIDNHKNKKQQNLQSSNGAFTLHMGNLDLVLEADFLGTWLIR